MLHGFQFAWKMMKKRPLRMGLTILQMAAGVAAITIVLSFIFSMLGLTEVEETEILEVTYGNQQGHIGGPYTGEMIKNIKKKSQYIKAISIVGKIYDLDIESNGVHYKTSNMYAVGADFPALSNMKLKEGSFFTQADVRNSSPVIVISEKVNRQLFGNESGIGKKIVYTGRRHEPKEVEIIGIFPLNDQLNPGPYESIQILYPYSSKEYYPEIWAMCKVNEVTEAKTELEMLINHEMEYNDPNMDPIFKLRNKVINEGRKEVAKTFGVFVGSFAMVSIIITSMGILSMMLVSIVERTREIGLRRALGASQLSIVGQIVSESIMISFIGGIFGVIIAILGFEWLANELFVSHWATAANLTIYPVLVALGTVVLIGLVVGLYPGVRAAGFVPVDAIREQ